MFKVEKGYWDNGQLQYEMPYKSNERYGISKWWYQNGQLKARILFKDNLFHGASERYHMNGEIKYIKFYLYGQFVTKEEYRKHILTEKLACLK